MRRAAVCSPHALSILTQVARRLAPQPKTRHPGGVLHHVRAMTVDSLDMAPEIPADVAAGATAVVVRISQDPPVQHQGSVTRMHPNALAITLDGAPCFVAGEAILVIVATSPRKSVRARFLASQDQTFAFQFDGGWTAVDARRDTRYVMDLDVQVRSVLGRSRQAGTVLNISPGGASVAVTTRPGGRQLELVLRVTGYSATLPCEITAITEAEDITVLHLRFAELSPPQQAFLRHVVGVARASAEAEEELAS